MLLQKMKIHFPTLPTVKLEIKNFLSSVFTLSPTLLTEQQYPEKYYCAWRPLG